MKYRLIIIIGIALCTMGLAGCSNATELIGKWYAYAEEKDGEIYYMQKSDEELVFDFIDSENADVYIDRNKQSTEYTLQDSVLTINIAGEDAVFTIKTISSSELVLHYLKENTLWHFSKINDISGTTETDLIDNSYWNWPYSNGVFWPKANFWPQPSNQWLLELYNNKSDLVKIFI